MHCSKAKYGEAFLFSFIVILFQTIFQRVIFKPILTALQSCSILYPTLFCHVKAKSSYRISMRASSWEHSLPSPESWKPFRSADEGGGGGGGALVPGRSGGSGGRGPPLWFSSPAREGSWGAAGKALEVLPFLLMGGGGGRGPEERIETSTKTLFAPYCAVVAHCCPCPMASH